MRIGLAVALLYSSNLLAGVLEGEVLEKTLANPTGVAIHPNGDIFIAARDGVYRYSHDHLHTEISGFNTDIYGKGPKYQIGPLGLALIGEDHLVVGDGSNLDEKEVVLVFKIGAESPEKPMTPADAAFTLGPIKAGADSAKGEGNYYGVATTPKGIFITCNGDDTKGWIAKSKLKDGKPGELKPFIATKVATSVDAPVGITADKEGNLIVGQMGEINVAGDSLLTMYNGDTGKLIKSMKTGLNDIAGVAIHPKTGKIYVVDYSWVDTTKGGLFRLDIEGDELKAEKIGSLEKPTALAFDAEGALYVTTLGEAKEEAAKTGMLIKFADVP